MKNTEAVSAFVALGQESRLNVFRLIVQRGDVGLTPSQIIEKLGIPNATLSFHLKELYQSNLITVERQSRNLIYRPNAKFYSSKWKIPRFFCGLYSRHKRKSHCR
jgi:DNA-binding transcriptional ArsR family regulator